LHGRYAAHMIAIMWNLPALLADMEAEPLAVAANQPLFHRGDAIRHLFVVEHGIIHLVRHQEDGTPTVMQRAQSGDLVAEASMFAAHYHCDAIAMAYTVLRRLPMRYVQARLAEDAAFARACAVHFAHEVHRMRVRSEIMGMKRVSGRLDAWLSLRPLPPKGEWAMLADDLGVTREALYRELARRRRSAPENGA
jgi:CRP-like cAMP-binding protein